MCGYYIAHFTMSHCTYPVWMRFLWISLFDKKEKETCQVVFVFLSSTCELAPSNAKWSWYFPIQTFGRLLMNAKHYLEEVSFLILVRGGKTKKPLLSRVHCALQHLKLRKNWINIQFIVNQIAAITKNTWLIST